MGFVLGTVLFMLASLVAYMANLDIQRIRKLRLQNQVDKLNHLYYNNHNGKGCDYV